MWESDPITITGSQNWSNAGEQDNDENTLIIRDGYITNQFMQEFKSRYNEAGGTGNFIIPVVDVKEEGTAPLSYSLYQNYPNPFNPTTIIRFELSRSSYTKLVVYDLLGRQVKVLFEGEAFAGMNEVEFNAENFASGVYLYTLFTDDFVATKKLMLLK